MASTNLDPLPLLSRSISASKLRSYVDVELHEVAKSAGVTIKTSSGKVNKGWAGHTVEHILGIPTNSFQEPDGLTWELKVIPVKRLKSGRLTFKETMAMTMINPDKVSKVPFKKSHLYEKMRSMLVVVREVGTSYSDPSYIRAVHEVDIVDHPAVLKQVEKDYKEVQKCIKDPTRGFHSLTGAMGYYIQPRTKGTGHGSTSRAFYARKIFMEDLGLLPDDS